MFTRTVGVAPGTTTIQLGAPDKALVVRNPLVAGEIQLGYVPTQARIRWDIIGAVGGGSLMIALLAGLVASAFERAAGTSSG